MASNKESVEEIPFLPSTIETIDVGMFNWLDQSLNLSTRSNSGWNKTPVIWLSTERAFQIKNNKDRKAVYFQYKDY